jgi:hypothetical protein
MTRFLKGEVLWEGNCALCGLPEHVDHIFFQCVLAQFVWSRVRSMLSVTWNPSNREDWVSNLNGLNHKSKRFLWLFFCFSMLVSLEETQ